MWLYFYPKQYCYVLFLGFIFGSLRRNWWGEPLWFRGCQHKLACSEFQPPEFSPHVLIDDHIPWIHLDGMVSITRAHTQERAALAPLSVCLSLGYSFLRPFTTFASAGTPVVPDSMLSVNSPPSWRDKAGLSAPALR